MFITFEGVEGAGKSTQLELLRSNLQEKGYKVLVTKQPGGSVLGLKIRHMILNPDEEDKPAPLTELLLYIADRAHHVETVIKPALSENMIVLCDRYTDSTVAYQGYARGFEPEMLEKLNNIATGGLKPVLTFILDLPPEEGLSRIKKYRTEVKLDRLEKEEIDFHRKVRKGFTELASKETERIRMLDADRSTEVIAEEVLKIVEALL